MTTDWRRKQQQSNQLKEAVPTYIMWEWEGGWQTNSGCCSVTLQGKAQAKVSAARATQGDLGAHAQQLSARVKPAQSQLA